MFVPGSSVGMLRGAGGAMMELFTAVCSLFICQVSLGQLLPTPGRQIAEVSPRMKGTGQIWLLPGHRSGSGGARFPVNILPWLSALGGVASGSWGRASGFGPWDCWPPGCGPSQSLACHLLDSWPHPAQTQPGPGSNWPFQQPYCVMYTQTLLLAELRPGS